MENEIEVKIMLEARNIATVTHFLHQQNVISTEKIVLGNTYFDTPDQFFAKEKMGLRIRKKNQQLELTLKMKGDILGGLHIRPEYNLPLQENKADFKKLVHHFQLPFEQAETIQQNLQAVFSTDFEREIWLIQFDKAQIEVALDQGLVKKTFASQAICEVEFELKQGEISDLFEFLAQFPKCDEMWLSSLSKAQRGYLVGRDEHYQAEMKKLIQNNRNQINEYAIQQQIVDYVRFGKEESEIFEALNIENKSNWQSAVEYLKSKDYLVQQIDVLKRL